MLQLLDLGRDVMPRERRRCQAAVFAPHEKPVAGSGVSPARVRVADVGAEEFDVAPGRFLAEMGDQCRDDVRARWSVLISACWIVDLIFSEMVNRCDVGIRCSGT